MTIEHRFLRSITLLIWLTVVGLSQAQEDGSIVAWGGNDYGQCDVPLPNMGFVAVTAGFWHSLGLKVDGSIVAWNGQPGGPPSPNTDFIAVEGGFEYSLGLNADGSVVAWGSNVVGQCEVPEPNTGFTAVAAGWGHSLGLKADGSVVAWGYNWNGECNVPAPNSGFVAVAAGGADYGGHSLGLKADGSIVAWGSNGEGQCDVPVPNANFIAVAAGWDHCLGLKFDGTIVAWGENDFGQCDVPTPNTDFVAVAAGYFHSLGLKANGSIYAWGWNERGQCDVPAPNTGFVGIAAGFEHSLGMRNYSFFTISGVIRDGRNQGIRDIAFGGFPGPTITDDEGLYHVHIPVGWQGTIIPQHAVLGFTPPQRSYSPVDHDFYDQNFDGLVEGPTSVDDIQVYEAMSGAPTSDYLRLLVELEGVVFVSPGTFSSGGGYIQSGDDGINYFFDYPVPDLQIGDLIRIEGYVWYDYNEEMYIGQPALDILGHIEIPQSRFVTIDHLVADYDNVGSFVETKGIVSEKGFLPGEEFEYIRLHHNGESVVVYNDPNTGTSFDEVDIGESWSVQGPCTKRFEEIRLFPRFQSDLRQSETRVWHVAVGGVDDSDGGSLDNPLATIQYAIDIALPYDEIRVMTGVYTGPGNRDLDFAGKPLLLRSNSGEPSDVILDCQGSEVEPHRGFFFHSSEDSTTVIRGLTVKGGYAAEFGGAVRIDIEDSGSEIISVRFENCVFQGNMAGSGGGAVAVGWNANWGTPHEPQFYCCRFFENSAPEGGGIFHAARSNVDCRDCRFYRNAANDGGALNINWFSVGSYLNCVFRENSALNGAGVFCKYEQDNVFTGCVFVGNVASRQGGAFCNPQGLSLETPVQPARINIDGKNDQRYNDEFIACDFDSNYAEQGGAVYIWHFGRWRFVGCRLRWNTADVGGAIYSWLNRDTYANCIFDSNIAGDGAAVYWWSGVDLEDDPPNITILSCTILRNSALGGGIISLLDLNYSVPVIGSCLIADNEGPAIVVTNQVYLPNIDCTDAYGNTGGDWIAPVDVLVGQSGNFAADPLFCDSGVDDYSLVDISPCLPGNHPDGTDCGQIGAAGAGCTFESESARIAPVPAESGPIACGGTSTLGFHYTPGTSTPALKGYSVRVIADGLVTFAPADFAVYTLPPGEQIFFQVYENAPNDYTIDYTILGTDTPGITTEEDLFSVLFHGAADGTATVQITEADFRDLENHTFEVVHDATAVIQVDCGPPQAVTVVAAEPGHQKVTLTWTDPADADLTSVKILRGLWQDTGGNSAYPLYGRLAGSTPPPRPASLQDALSSGRWTEIADLTPGTGTYTDDLAARGIYYYEIFAIDDVGNASVPALESDRATNYWLGDIAPGGGDGYVNILDMSGLGDSYGVASGHPSFSAVADVGPTDDASGTGIPLPDGLVAFDDLMIVGQTFGEVGPAKSELRQSQDLLLVWRQEGEQEWSCRLAQPCANLKGLRVTANLPVGVGVSLVAGSLLSEQTGPVFLQNAGEDLDVGLCLLGQNLGFDGEGELFRVVLTGVADLSGATIEARSVENEQLEVAITTEVADAVPQTFAASPNYPNPFNAATTIQFDLPEPQRAEVAVYSIDGRRVRSLLSQQLPAGRHAVQWDGSDDHGGVVASGAYFYRIEAGPYRASQKMVLAK